MDVCRMTVHTQNACRIANIMVSCRKKVWGRQEGLWAPPHTARLFKNSACLHSCKTARHMRKQYGKKDDTTAGWGGGGSQSS